MSYNDSNDVINDDDDNDDLNLNFVNSVPKRKYIIVKDFSPIIFNIQQCRDTTVLILEKSCHTLNFVKTIISSNHSKTFTLLKVLWHEILSMVSVSN